MAQLAWGQEAQAAPAKHPSKVWKEAMRLSAQAKIRAQQMRLAEALSLFAQSRSTLQSLHKQWPSYRRPRIMREMRRLQKEREKVYLMVAHEGLVEYHGKFLPFDQMQRVLEVRQQTTAQWMEMLKAQEEVRRIKTERMVEEEARRHIEERRERQERQDRIWREQERQNNLNREYQRQRQEDERRRQERMFSHPPQNDG